METHENIKLLREQLGLSQEELAIKVGYKDRSSIAKIEAGLVDLPLSKIALFATTLGVSPTMLMGYEDPTSENIIKIAGRDGSFVEKRLSDKQLQALKSFVDLLPDASDDL